MKTDPIRLRNEEGKVGLKGTLEMLDENTGQWWTVAPYYTDHTLATVICRQLGVDYP